MRAVVASLAALAGIAGTAITVHAQHTFAVTCRGDVTAALQRAVLGAEVTSGNTVSIGAGTCALYDHVAVAGPNAVTITGAGAKSTFLVQHARVNIFEITTPGSTVENMNLNTGKFNTTYPPDPKNPDPGVLFSNSSQTTVRSVTAEAGTGFGMRLTGPNPCDAHPVTGAVVDHVSMTNLGTGGFSSIDVDCQQSASITNITVHGGSVTPYEDAMTTINGFTYQKGRYGETCEPAWEVTGTTTSTSTATISNVTSSAGYGRALNGAVVTVSNETLAAGDACPTPS